MDRADHRRGRATAIAYGVAAHAAFAVAIAAMVATMYGGMTTAFGRVPAPGCWAVDAALLLQFPLGHSFLLSARGRTWLARLAPFGLGKDLATTTFAAIAAVEVAALFLLWTPSGVVWWSAAGGARVALTAAYAASWLLLFRSMREAGLALQTGALGWRAVLAGRDPVHPPLPTRGLHALVRQPIYVSFALTTVTVPTWTPDQAAVAAVLVGHCVLGPRWKEARFARWFGDDFRRYRERVPYWLPWPRPRGAR